jgi:transposase
VELSQKELQRIKVIENAVEGRITVAQASELLNLSERQVQRLKARYESNSVDWVRHGNRSRPKPWAMSEAVREQILTLARDKYAGFNDSHLTEKLNKVEGIEVSREAVRQLLRGAGMRSPQKRRARKFRKRREPKARMGMMLLADASRHDWLEGRGPMLTLMGYQATPLARC